MPLTRANTHKNQMKLKNEVQSKLAQPIPDFFPLHQISPTQLAKISSTRTISSPAGGTSLARHSQDATDCISMQIASLPRNRLCGRTA